MSTSGTEAPLLVDALRGAEAPLFHGCAGGWVWAGALVARAQPRSLAALGVTNAGDAAVANQKLGPGAEAPLLVDALRGAEAPLFHGCAGGSKTYSTLLRSAG
jgi:hypothetical protein